VAPLALVMLSLAMAAPPKDVKADLKKPFSHDSHLALTKTDKGQERRHTCSDCHTVKQEEKQTEPSICTSTRMPFPNHDKCINCHSSAFFKPPIVICTNCHVDTKITEKSPLKEQTGMQAPLRTEFDHNLHLDPKQRVKNKFKFEKDCSFCHKFVKGGEKVLLPEHPQCCECHTKPDVKPQIDDCAGCHYRPKSENNPSSKVKKFSHVQHKTDPSNNQSLPCVRCHFDVPKSTKISTLILPKMATCVECHQGELAFSYADCLKCHEKGIETKLLPPDHPK
jgi:c(7)-type cytochrome triheme protein